MSVVFSQLLSDLLAPVTDQVPEHISDYSNILSLRAHIKNSINTPLEVRDAPPLIVSSLNIEGTQGFIILSFSQTLSPISLSSESSLAFTPPAPEWPEGSEVKGEGKLAVGRLDHCCLLKRKWTSVVEEGGHERSDDRKRAKPGELLEFNAQTCMQPSNTCTLSTFAAFVSYFLFADLSVQSQQG